MSKLSKNSAPTYESVWAAFKETDRKMQETFMQMKETDRQMQETDRKIKEYQENYERRMTNMEKLTGAWSFNHGCFAEDYFFNSFAEGRRNFFGETFNEIRRKIKPFEEEPIAEYDIVLLNCTSVAIIEVKFKAHENDIAKVLKKAQSFRGFYPDFKDYKLYLGLASMAFYPELEQKCMNEGIAIIKQVGDNVIMNDKHLKVF